MKGSGSGLTRNPHVKAAYRQLGAPPAASPPPSVSPPCRSAWDHDRDRAGPAVSGAHCPPREC